MQVISQPLLTGRVVVPSASLYFRHVWYVESESYGNGVAIDSLTDRSVRGYSKALSATSTARPTCTIDSTVLKGKKFARFDGTNDRLQGATAADWQFLNDGHPLSVFVVARVVPSNPNALYPFLDTCNFVSSNRGFSFYTDDRAASTFNQALRGAIQRAAVGVSAISVFGVNNVFNNQMFNVFEFQLAPQSAPQRSLIAKMADARLLVNGLSAGQQTWTTSSGFSQAAPTYPLTLGASGDVTTFFGNIDVAFVGLCDKILPESERLGVLEWFRQMFDVWPVTLISQQQNFNAAPVCCKLDDGSLLVSYQTISIEFNASAQDIPEFTVMVKSGDKGQTWSPEKVVYIDEQAQTGPGALFVTTAKTVLLSVVKYTDPASTIAAQFLLRSTDRGMTWGSAIDIHTMSGWTYISRQSGGFCQLSNGTILQVVFGRNSASPATDGVKVLQSTDDGVVWTVLATVTAGNGAIDYAEQTVVKLSGTFPTESLILTSRDNTTSPNKIVKWVSSDSGSTWTGPTNLLTSHYGRAFAWKASSGKCFLMCRPTGVNNRAVIRWSSDDFVTMSSADYLFDTLDAFNHYSFVVPDYPVAGQHFIVTASSPLQSDSPDPTLPHMEIVRGQVVNEADIIAIA